MDKETLSNYGWIVIAVLVLVVMIALATPFGDFVANSVKSTTQGLFDTNQKALNQTGLINMDSNEFDDDALLSIEKLQSKYKFYYYDSALSAIESVNENKIKENENTTKENAIAGVYITKNSTPCVVLLKDSIEAQRVELKTDVILNLAGNTLRSEDDVVMDILSGNIIINGKIDGSSIEVVENNKGNAIQIHAGNVTFNGGYYYSLSNNAIASKAGTILRINNCHTKGARNGISSKSTLYIDGGLHEGWFLGGIYFSGKNTTSYVKNATIQDVDDPEYSNFQGMFIGGNVGNDNITVYMDNCNIKTSGAGPGIVFRGTSGELNNKIYISNSILECSNIRLDGGGHTLYIGMGNNFTENKVTYTNREIDQSLPKSTVVTTNENYAW